MLKWTIAYNGGSVWSVYNSRGNLIAGGVDYDTAEKLVAAHNAVIDMAFDSPGNVS